MEKEKIKCRLIKEKKFPFILIEFSLIIIIMSLILMLMTKQDSQKEINKEAADNKKAYEVIIKGAVLDNIASTYVTSSTGINFAVAPSDTNGKGIYIRSGTENNRYPIYYYRGAVTDNNVIFANFCWKIVRTTETGGIKLIYNGSASDGKCTSTGTASQLQKSQYNRGYKDNAYVGYMYGAEGADTYEATHLSTKASSSSTVKSIVDAWYKKNIDDKGYTSKLEDTVWCNDRSITTYNDATGSGTGTSVTYYSGFTRVGLGAGNDIQPSLDCENLNDRFTVSASIGNGALTYPIALLTADEVTLAGNGWHGYSDSSYLYTGESWALMSPHNFEKDGARKFGVYKGLYSSSVVFAAGVRPSVALKNDTEFLNGGNGTINNPYIVK